MPADKLEYVIRRQDLDIPVADENFDYQVTGDVAIVNSHTVIADDHEVGPDLENVPYGANYSLNAGPAELEVLTSEGSLYTVMDADAYAVGLVDSGSSQKRGFTEFTEEGRELLRSVDELEGTDFVDREGALDEEIALLIPDDDTIAVAPLKCGELYLLDGVKMDAEPLVEWEYRAIF